MVLLHEHLGEVRTAIAGLMQRFDRDADMDEDATELRYLPSHDPMHTLVLQ